MFDPVHLLQTVGYLGMFLIVFAESGILIGFFLPGDSLLFTAGILASQGILNIFVLIPLTFTAAVLGDSVGYAFGRRVGHRIFRREDSFFFHKDHLKRAEYFYEHYGAKTIVLARFMPVVRTFAPIVAGIGKMRYPKFLFYNILGGILWGIGLVSLGYLLGRSVPGIDRFLLPIIIVIIVASATPPFIEMFRQYRKQKRR